MKIVLQRDLKDCGVCCLASIIKHYKGDVSLEKIRLDTNTTKEGTTALNIILASKKYGFDACGVSINDLEEIKTLPAIAHLNLENGLTHFVVIYKITKDNVIVMDPSKGKKVVRKDDFLKKWSKVAILFYPHQKILILKSENTLLKIFKRIIRSEKKLLTKIILISTVLTILTIIGGYYFQVMGKLIEKYNEFNYLKYMILGFATVIVFKIVLTYMRMYLENFLSKNIDCILNYDFLKHLYNLPLKVLSSRTSGEIITRVNELMNVKSFITDLFITITLDVFLMIITIPLLINISGNLFFILFLMMLLYLLVGIISSKPIYHKVYQNIEHETIFNNCLIEDIKMINSIKNLDETDGFFKRLEVKLTSFLYDSYLFNEFINKEICLKECIMEIGLFLINTVGFYYCLTGKINIISLVTFNTLLTFFTTPFKKFIDGLPKYNFLKASIDKLNEFLSVDEEQFGKLERINNYMIEFNNLKYSYNKINYLIKDLNIKIKENEFISLDGPSGSGKSTICNILEKYLTDYEGNVLVGNINIKDISTKTIRNLISYVNQNEFLFTGTIKENITIFKNFDEEKFFQVAKICRLENIVKDKILRYETIINSEATNISGGEMQRIILARALMKDFKILILDEALSEVDINLEKDIIKDLKKFYHDKTIIYITHKKYSNLFDRTINIGVNQ